MYEHAYHMDFGANAKAYIESFMRNVDYGHPARALRGCDEGLAAAHARSSPSSATTRACPSRS
jgi:hypothetical protein